MTELPAWLRQGVDAVGAWQESFAGYETHPSQQVDQDVFRHAFGELIERLGAGNYPYFHPDFAGPDAQAATPGRGRRLPDGDAGQPEQPRATTAARPPPRMEREAVAWLAEMFGLPRHLGHLTGGGTVANLEALFVARESHPGKGIAYSADAPLHARADVLTCSGSRGTRCRSTRPGGCRCPRSRTCSRPDGSGTVVLTAGTTGLGAVDPIHEALALRERYGVRLHVDAAYGGFYTLLRRIFADAAAFDAIASCDSVVVDPHKHGLQPYGCGAVLFADPSVARFYHHDSPYTYFTESDLHLGEISLECSRPGAAAAALWLTLRVLGADGLARDPRGEPARGAALVGAAAEYSPLTLVTRSPRSTS